MVIIRTKYFLMVVGIAAALMAAGCASEVVEAPAVEPAAAEAPMAEAAMEPDTPVTEAPRELGVGTVRTYNHTVNGETYELAYTIAERQEYKGNTVSFQTLSTPVRDPGGPCDGANNVLEDVATLSYVACLKDGKLLSALSPNDGRFKWPLQVGNSWRGRYQYIDKVLHPDWSGPGWQEFAVVAWEEVTVPSGTFMAYKVARTKGDWDTAKEEEYIIWYAPESQMIVKVIFTRSPKNGYGASDQSWELVSYDLK